VAAKRPRWRTAFDADYFRRFYMNPATRVTTRAEMAVRAELIAAILRQAQIPVRSILDAGCGLGLMRPAFRRVLPKAKYQGLERSAYLCRRFGWQRGTITSYAPPQVFDLVVCYDLLQYLDDKSAAAALTNLPQLTRAAIYISALTSKDWRQNCDRSKTDISVHLRSGAWYRRRLEPFFKPLGCGVWIRKDVTAILWEMEQPP
jgi:SAM-dependent methyltransferase